jgi:hypothetical protein
MRGQDQGLSGDTDPVLAELFLPEVRKRHAFKDTSPALDDSPRGQIVLGRVHQDTGKTQTTCFSKRDCERSVPVSLAPACWSYVIAYVATILS